MNIYVLNALEWGIDQIQLMKKEIPIRGVIGLSKKNRKSKVTGYRHPGRYCRENGLDYLEVGSYSLTDPIDQKKLLNLKIDILIVVGWQRLIPSWLIEHCRVCTVGTHGSADGIVGGRGRSTQNWALLLGKKEFSISIFSITAGMDAGPVIDTQQFALDATDDIKTSYCKWGWLAARMIVDNLKNGRIASKRFTAQKGKPRYLPQRCPEDGEIDWSRSSGSIHDFVRALTHPYPGAFSRFDGGSVWFWKGRPLQVGAGSKQYRCGQIAHVYANGDLLIRAGDSFFLAEEYSVEYENREMKKSILKEGTTFHSCDFKKQIEGIVLRHYQKHPRFLIAKDILDLRKS